MVGMFGSLLRELAFVCLFPLRKSKWAGRAYFLYELIFFAVFAVLFFSTSVKLQFPAFRAYMFVGVLFGFALSYKILQIIVAFFKKVCYNRYAKKFRERKNSENKR